MTRKFQKNVIVLHEGDQSNALYIIDSGQIKVSKINDQGKEVVLCILGDGDHFGEMSLIDDEPRSASIITKTPKGLNFSIAISAICVVSLS